MKKCLFTLTSALIGLTSLTPPILAGPVPSHLVQQPIQQTVLELLVLVENEAGYALPYQKIDLLDLEKDDLPVVASLKTDKDGLVRFNQQSGLLYHHRYGLAINGQHYPLQVESQTPTQWVEKVVLGQEDQIQPVKDELIKAKEPLSQIRLQLIDTDLKAIGGQKITLVGEQGNKSLVSDAKGQVIFKTTPEDRQIYQIYINGQASDYYTSNFASMRLIFNKTLLANIPSAGTNEASDDTDSLQAPNSATGDDNLSSLPDSDGKAAQTPTKPKRQADANGEQLEQSQSLVSDNASTDGQQTQSNPGENALQPHIYRKRQPLKKLTTEGQNQARPKASTGKTSDAGEGKERAGGTNQSLGRPTKDSLSNKEAAKGPIIHMNKETDPTNEPGMSDEAEGTATEENLVTSRRTPPISANLNAGTEKVEKPAKKSSIASRIARLLPQTGEKILRLSALGLSCLAAGILLFTKFHPSPKRKDEAEEESNADLGQKTAVKETLDLTDDEWFLE